MVRLILVLLVSLGGCTFEGTTAPDPSAEADAAPGTPDATVATIAFRINLGGGSVLATGAPNAGMWDADNDQCGGIPFGPVEPVVNGTVDHDLYTYYRYDTVTCDLQIANGSYQVRFLLAEVWNGGGNCNSGASRRDMELEIEGQTLASFDLVSETGGCAADPAQTGAVPFERTFEVEVTDGVLNVAGLSNGDGALLSAIEVVSL